MLALLPEILILSSAVIILLVDLFVPKAKGKLIPLALILIFLSFLIPLILIHQVFFAQSEIVSGAFYLGKAIVFFRFLIIIIVFYIISFSSEIFKKFNYKSEFLSLILFACLGMMMTVSANDLIVLFLSIELMAVSFYLLAAIYKNKIKSLEAGIKYFFMGTVSAAFLLFGFSLIFGITGSTNFQEIQMFLQNQEINEIIKLSIIFIIIAFGFKIALFPFQMWIPDVYEGAPTPVTAYLAAGSKVAVLVAFLRILNGILSPYYEFVSMILLVLAVFSLIYGNMLALIQKNIKRLIAFSSIGQAGFILLGFLTFSQGFRAVTTYLVSYSISTLIAFCSVIIIYGKIKSHNIEDYKNLGKRYPLPALMLTLSLLSLIGLPPFPIFWGKAFVLMQALSGGYLLLVILALITTVISAYYYLHVIKIIYLEKTNMVESFKSGFFEKLLFASLIIIFAVLSITPDIIYRFT